MAAVAIALRVALVTAIHDSVVGDWEISNFRAFGSTDQVDAGAPWSVHVRFKAKWRKWVVGRLFGKKRPGVYSISLAFDKKAVCWDGQPSLPARQGFLTASREVSERFTLTWNPARDMQWVKVELLCCDKVEGREMVPVHVR